MASYRLRQPGSRSGKARCAAGRLSPAAAAALALGALVASVSLPATSFAGMAPSIMLRGNAARSSTTLRRARGMYPDLSKLEDNIAESCQVMPGQDGVECMKVYRTLVEAHFKAQEECDVDSNSCQVLLVLDRLAWGTSGKDGLALLEQMRESVEAFHSIYENWGDAFSAIDTDSSGDIDQKELGAALRKTNPGITDMTIGRLFRAADTDLDGVINAEEFSNFLMAGALAAEPLKQLLPDRKKREGGTEQELFQWAARGSMDQRAQASALGTDKVFR